MAKNGPFQPLALVSVSVALLTAGAGCSSTPYEYDAVSEPTPITRGMRYTVPQDPDLNPSGTVAVNTYGVTQLSDKKESTPEIRALHARVILHNTEQEKDGAWKFNVSNQTVELPGEGSSRVAYANTADSEGDLPLIKVEPGEERKIDLYFPLPQGYQSAEQIPSFTLHWIVETEAKTVSDITRFDREQIQPEIITLYPNEPYPFDDDRGLGWGDQWWYEPTYPEFAFPRATIVPPIINIG